jgi:hypothetical protein
MKTNTVSIISNFICLTCLFFSCAKSSEKCVEVKDTVVDSPKLATPLPTPDLSVPEGWILVQKPKENSPVIRCAGSRRDFQWRVETEKEKVKISKYDEWAIDEQIEKLPLNLREIVLQTRDIGNGTAYFHIEPYENGWLAGLDAGEWGGRLTWFSSDGSQKTVILHDNIQGIAKVGNEVLILTGIAHISDNEGGVSKLTKDYYGNFQIQPLVDLKSMPLSFVVESNESILISLRDKIVRVKTSGEIETWRDMPFNRFNVSTARTDSGIVYVGMWLFVVRFIPTPGGIQEQWLQPENCQKFSLKKDDCVCQVDKSK